jgi:hypothetical protein
LNADHRRAGERHGAVALPTASPSTDEPSVAGRLLGINDELGGSLKMPLCVKNYNRTKDQ